MPLIHLPVGYFNLSWSAPILNKLGKDAEDPILSQASGNSTILIRGTINKEKPENYLIKRFLNIYFFYLCTIHKRFS